MAFTSPSIVDRFCLRFGPAAVPPVAVCIGPRTADRARQRGLDGLVTATEHTADGLVAALTAALAGAPHTTGEEPQVLIPEGLTGETGDAQNTRG